MTLVVFDMDGTLLNAESAITPYTAETLALMREAAIPYTVATGRTLQACAWSRSKITASPSPIYSKTGQSFGAQSSRTIATAIYSPNRRSGMSSPR